MTNSKTNRILHKALPIGLLIVVLIFPLVVRDRFTLSILIEAGAMALVALGFAAVFRSGQLSLGQAAFAAVGGYAGGLMAARFGFPFWLALIVGGVAAAIVAFLLGVVVLRLGGLYFSITTIALGEIAVIVARNWDVVTGGVTGVAVVPPLIEIGNLTVDFATNKMAFYYVVVLLVVLSGLVLWRIDQSRMGRIMKSVAVNPTLSEHLGMHLMKYRVIVFTVACFITGVGGVFYVFYNGWVGPSLFTGVMSNTVLIMCVIGGIWSMVSGPIIGSLIVTYFGTLMQIRLEGLRPLVFGATVVILLMLLPNGLVDLQYKFPSWIKGLLKRKSTQT